MTPLEQEFLDAVNGPEVVPGEQSGMSRLSWLRALLTDLAEDDYEYNSPDPASMRECLAECRDLVRLLEAAAGKARTRR